MTSNTNIHSTINNTIFCKCVTRSFRFIYVNCFNRLRFLAEVRTFLDNLKTITQEGNMVTRQMTHLLFLFVIFISEFENTQNSFSCGPPFGLFWSVKYLNFWPKATHSDSLRLLEIYIMFCSPAGAKYSFF